MNRQFMFDVFAATASAGVLFAIGPRGGARPGGNPAGHASPSMSAHRPQAAAAQRPAQRPGGMVPQSRPQARPSPSAGARPAMAGGSSNTTKPARLLGEPNGPAARPRKVPTCCRPSINQSGCTKRWKHAISVAVTPRAPSVASRSQQGPRDRTPFNTTQNVAINCAQPSQSCQPCHGIGESQPALRAAYPRNGNSHHPAG